MIFRRKVQHGQKRGRTLGFPTLNLRVGIFAEHYEPGVYACWVKVQNVQYTGALHFGPKKGAKKPVLEIHLLNFDQFIYGQWIHFSIEKHLRAPKKFEDWKALKKQIEKDLERIKKL